MTWKEELWWKLETRDAHDMYPHIFQVCAELVIRYTVVYVCEDVLVWMASAVRCHTIG